VATCRFQVARRPATPCGRHRDRDRLHGQRREGPVAAKVGDQPGEGLVKGAAGGSGQARLARPRRESARRR
jgi:hypothetical protein